MKARALAVLVGLLCGCGAYAHTFYVVTLTEEEFDQKIEASPFLKFIGKTRFAARPAGTVIEVYYKRFGIWHVAHNANEPNAKHFIMGKPSDPGWSYVRIAQVEIYKTLRADPIVIAAMKKQALAIGGDALTDCQRDPVLLKGSQYGATRGSNTSYMEVAGYDFTCTVVRRKD